MNGERALVFVCDFVCVCTGVVRVGWAFFRENLHYHFDNNVFFHVPLDNIDIVRFWELVLI